MQKKMHLTFTKAVLEKTIILPSLGLSPIF